MKYDIWMPEEVFKMLDALVEHKKQKAELILSYIKPENDELIKIRDQFMERDDVPEDMKTIMVSMFNKNIENNQRVISKAEEIARMEGTH